MSSEKAFEAAGALLALTISLHGWPLPEDRVTRREDERVRESWARLRRFYGRP